MEEAREFINRVIKKIGVKQGENALDLACGKGRHSLTLHEAGLNVVGLDLAAESIKEANRFKAKNLSFVQGDMRTFELPQKFNYVFNFFTSFGYFDDQSDNLAVLRRIHEHLLPGGLVLIDFLNPVEVEGSIVPEEKIIKDDIVFHVKRYIQKGKIQKEIRFEDDGKQFEFKEEVQELRKADFEALFASSGFKLVEAFGDYNLNPFEEASSKRMILIGKKI